MKPITMLLVMIFSLSLHAQHNNDTDPYFSVALSNAHTAKPFGSFQSLFHQEFHPGIEMGYGKNLLARKRHEWLVEVKLGYQFHRWVQHNVSVSINGAYQHQVGKSWRAGLKLGGGYQLSAPTGKVFAITSNGLAEKGRPPRSQLIVDLGLAVDKKISASGCRVFMEYRQRLQTPFIREYVPLLPYNMILIGANIPTRLIKSL